MRLCGKLRIFTCLSRLTKVCGFVLFILFLIHTANNGLALSGDKNELIDTVASRHLQPPNNADADVGYNRYQSRDQAESQDGAGSQLGKLGNGRQGHRFLQSNNLRVEGPVGSNHRPVDCHVTWNWNMEKIDLTEQEDRSTLCENVETFPDTAKPVTLRENTWTQLTTGNTSHVPFPVGVSGEGWLRAFFMVSEVDKMTARLRDNTARRLNSSRSCGRFGRGISSDIYLSHTLRPRKVFMTGHSSYFYNSSYLAPDDVTLITQLSTSRLKHFYLMVRQWLGPMVAAVYVAPADYEATCNRLASWLQQQGSRTNILLLIIHSTGRLFPVNWLRNLTHKYVLTSFVFMVDVDFVPSPNLYRQIRNYTAAERRVFDTSTALIVTAFEARSSNFSLPTSKSELLLRLVNYRHIQPFHYNRHAFFGHKLTNYNKWKSVDRLYTVSRREISDCFRGQEPYMVVKLQDAPVMPETLLHRQYNKWPYFTQLCLQHFQFQVLPGEFLLHARHRDASRQVFPVLRCTTTAYKAFNRHLEDVFHIDRKKYRYLRVYS